MELSYRMNQIAECVTSGNRLADVGTDHGFIPIYLVLNNQIPKAIALDVGNGPLTRAREHVRQYHLESRIECRLSDGLTELSPLEVDSIIIAGMGGDLMSRILREGKPRFSGNKELILQPQSEYYKVRQILHEMQYQIVEERFFMEDGKYYNVMKALPGREQYVREVDYRYGYYLLKEHNPVLKQFLKQRLQTLQQIEEQICNRTDTLGEKTKQRLHEMKEEQRLLVSALISYEQVESEENGIEV